MFMEIPMLDIDPGASLASCCDGPDCQPAPYGTGNAWYGIGTHHGGNDPYPCEGSYYPYNVRAEPVTFPQQLSSLNQTFGWGCESGDSYGNSGTSFDSGSSTNQPNTADVWKVYSAVGTNNGGIDASSSKLSFIGSVGVNGGQGNSDCIYGSCSDHNTYGVSGSGWQGPGNGEAPGDLWNPVNDESLDLAHTTNLGAWVSGPTGQGAQSHSVCNNLPGANCIPTGANCECTTGKWLPDQDAVPIGFKGAQVDVTTALRVSDFQVPDSTGRLGGDLDVGHPCANTWCQTVPDTQQHALAGPLALPPAEDKPKGVRPTPAHFVMTGHALAFGVISATSKLFSGNSKGWSEDLKNDSAEAADTITPIGGYVLKNAFSKA